MGIFRVATPALVMAIAVTVAVHQQGTDASAVNARGVNRRADESTTTVQAVTQATTTATAAGGQATATPSIAVQELPGLDKVVRMAVVNAEPVHVNLTATMEKACKFIEAAGKANVDLMTFSEAFLSGYPWWNFWHDTFDIAGSEQIMSIYAQNSATVGTSDLDPLLQCIKAAKVNVVMPISERDNTGSRSAVFNTALFIDKYGRIQGRHRKTLPSFTERFWWTAGDGSDLIVVDMPDVGRVCALLCWENYIILARYTLLSQGCEFWVAPTQDLGPSWEAHIQSMGREGRVYVLGVGQMLNPKGPSLVNSEVLTKVKYAYNDSNWHTAMLKDFDRTLGPSGKKFFMDGGSTIADPDGNQLVQPVHSNFEDSVKQASQGCKHSLSLGAPVQEHCQLVTVDGYNGNEEFIVVANGTRGEVLRKKTMQDNFGNYARNDIWSVTWHDKPQDYIFRDTDTPKRDQYVNGMNIHDNSETGHHT